MSFVTLAGRLGHDISKKASKNGKDFWEFSLAVPDRKVKDKTTWYKITSWREHPLFAYLKKGAMAVVHGELRAPEIYYKKDGTGAIALNVDFYEFLKLPAIEKKEDDRGEYEVEKGAAKYSSNISDEDIPF